MSERDPNSLPAGNPESGRNDDGTWAKGRPGGPGRPKKAKIKDAIEGQYADKPTEFMYRRVADGLGIETHEVPVFEEVQQLQVWAFLIRSLDGSQEHAKELLDRTDPKPSRATVDIRQIRAPITGGDVGEEEADDYYERLTGDVGDEG